MLLVFGSVNLDIAFSAPRLPGPGETVMGQGYLVSPGGKGANQAHAARQYGVPVTLAAAVGRDAFAESALSSLAAAGVDLVEVQWLDAPTGCAGIVVDAQGENQIVVAPGANLALRSAHVSDALLSLAHTVLLQMETDPAENAILLRRAKAQGCRTILNNAPARPVTVGMLGDLDVLVVNETELTETARSVGITAATAPEVVAALSSRFNLAVVLTLGSQGVLACLDGQVHQVPALAVDAVDTTGAGDTFTGVMAAALMEGHDWPQALRRASAAAALACTRPGAQVAQPARAEIEALLAR